MPTPNGLPKGEVTSPPLTALGPHGEQPRLPELPRQSLKWEITTGSSGTVGVAPGIKPARRRALSSGVALSANGGYTNACGKFLLT